MVRVLDLKSRVRVPFWQPAGVVLNTPEFNSSVMFVNSQLICLPPASRDYFVFDSSFISTGPENPHWGSGELRYFVYLDTYCHKLLEYSSSFLKDTHLLHGHFFVQVWLHANGINISIRTSTKFVLSHHIVINVFWKIGLRQQRWVLQKKQN